MSHGMTAPANRSRTHRAASALLGAVLLTSCIEIKDVSDEKKAAAAKAAVADSAGGTVVKAPPQQSTGRPVTFGPDSVNRVRGGPMSTPEAIAALQTDTVHSVTDIDTTTFLPVPEGDVGMTKGVLLIPVQGIAPTEIFDTYDEKRGGGTRNHEALDIPAPRGTPVLSATGGRVLKLFDSKAGGKMVYAADSSSASS